MGFFSNNNLLTSIVLIAISSFLTHIFDKWRLKDERINEFKKYTGKEIAESLQVMNDLAVQTSSMEKYDIEGSLKRGELIKKDEPAWYPTVMESRDEFFAFLEKINNCRRVHEKNLSNSVSVGLK